MAEAPSSEILAAFGLRGSPTPLVGGQGEAFRVGDVVLKRATVREEVEWSAGVLASLSSSAFRVPQHLRAKSGDVWIDGWFAQTLLAGAHDFHRWPAVLEACAAFHEAVRPVAKPAFMARRSDPWAVADRITWGEEPLRYSPALAPLVEPLVERLATHQADSQVVHGDFAGNVLFADGLPPAVIDFTPYWRPASFAEAVVIVDAITWHGADAALIDRAAPQMLLRAELRRLFEIDQHLRTGREIGNDLRAHRGIVLLLSSETGAGRPHGLGD